MPAYRHCASCSARLLFPQHVVPVCGQCFPEWVEEESAK